MLCVNLSKKSLYGRHKIEIVNEILINFVTKAYGIFKNIMDYKIEHRRTSTVLKENNDFNWIMRKKFTDGYIFELGVKINKVNNYYKINQ